MNTTNHPIRWLHHAGQHLALVPTLGGSVAAWQIEGPKGIVDIWRPWDGRNPDLYSLASFPLVPWSNRISDGGFEQSGTFHPIACNRVGEPYPIHGDGWLQAWTFDQPEPDTAVMTLESTQFDAGPYSYRAEQRFVLVKGGMHQTLTVTHTGPDPLPYGLGQHPCFVRTPATKLTASVQGVWLSGNDPLPTGHTRNFPPGWNPQKGMDANGTLIDNAYTGWPGLATISRPEDGLELTVRVPDILARGEDDGYCLLYRPPGGSGFCFEPVTHPIDAFHAPGRPGLKVLQTGQSMTLDVQWNFNFQI